MRLFFVAIFVKVMENPDGESITVPGERRGGTLGIFAPLRYRELTNYHAIDNAGMVQVAI